MADDLSDIASRGIARLENEMLVRDFLEVLACGENSSLAPFLHREVRFRIGTEPELVGSRAVLLYCERFAHAFPRLRLRIDALSCDDDTVLVEESVGMGFGERREFATVTAFASFRIRDYQIANWRQVYA